MGVRELAEADLGLILENPNASGSPYTIIDPLNNEFSVCGTVGDISLLIDPATGEAIRSRSIVATCRIKTLAEKTSAIPERGWKAIINDLAGKPYNLFIQGNEPDRTIGIYNLRMGLNLEPIDE